MLETLNKTIKVLEDYVLAVTSNADSAEAYYHRGELLANDQPFLALQAYYKAIEHNHHYAEAYFKVAGILTTLGYLDEALGAYQNAIRINPDYKEAYYNQGIILQTLEERNAAAADHRAGGSFFKRCAQVLSKVCCINNINDDNQTETYDMDRLGEDSDLRAIDNLYYLS